MSQHPSEQVQQKFLVVDDHEVILSAIIVALKEKYPSAEILTAQDALSAKSLFERYHPDLVVVDLSIPHQPHVSADPKVGIQWLLTLMSGSPAPNILVLSTNVKPLLRLFSKINTYGGGFAAMDKSQPIQEMLKLIDVALRGAIQLPLELELWREALILRYKLGLTDKAIAKRLKVSDRTLRHYWFRIQDALGDDDEFGQYRPEDSN